MENGAIIWDALYGPYGEFIYFDNNSNMEYGYTGQEQDSTDWYYYGARYYSPEIGRFLQPDPLFDGPNPYMYVHGNPVRYVDPSGMARHSGDDYDPAEFSESVWFYMLMQDVIENMAPPEPETVSAPDAAIGTVMEAWDPPPMPQLGPFERLLFRGIRGLVIFGRALIEGWDVPYVDPYGNVLLRGEMQREAFGSVMSTAMISVSALATSSNVVSSPTAAFHHTFDENAKSIARVGLRPGSYATPTEALSPLQANRPGFSGDQNL